MRGKLFRDSDGEQVVVGDEVIVGAEGEDWTVEQIMPRRNEFVRQGLRKQRQVMFANVDRVLIIASLSSPQTKTNAIDRFLVTALRGKIEPVLVLTKTDLDQEHLREAELRALYESFSVRVYPVSQVKKSGHAELLREIGSGTTALIGNSGVGKTSLMNALIPGLDLETREVSAWSGKGTHTTTAALLVSFVAADSENTAYLIDTPGMKSFAPYGIDRESLIELFPDLHDLIDSCRFTNCGHGSEPGCALQAAAAANRNIQARLKSYQRLLADLS